MATKTQSTLSNKSSAASAKASNIKVSDLLQALPSADVVQAESSAAPAAVDRRREFEERKATREARIEHTRALRDSYAAYLIRRFVGLMAVAKEKGYGWVTIEKAPPPSKEEDKESGQLVFVHEAHETHWAGMGEDGEPLPAMEGGAPKVMLLQGPKPRKADARGRRDADPKDLPDGQTSVDVMRAAVASRGYGVQVAYIKGMVNVIVIWDHEAWGKAQAHQQAHQQQKQRQHRSQERGAEAVGQISYEEYQAQKAVREAKRATTASAAADTWQKAKPRRNATEA